RRHHCSSAGATAACRRTRGGAGPRGQRAVPARAPSRRRPERGCAARRGHRSRAVGRRPARIGRMPAAYRGVLLDLFGTLISFEPARLPELQVGGERIRTPVGGLASPLAAWVPGTTPEEFLRALVTVSDEMARARAHERVELPSRERFRRALERVGCDDTHLAEAAVHLSRAHMGIVASATTLPDDHQVLLAALRPRYRLGLVSNFDDTATAYEILRRHGLL